MDQSDATDLNTTSTCPADCPSCPSAADAAPQVGPLTGWRLGAAAAGAFLLPLTLATVGSAIVSPELQLVGCLVGLACGAVVAGVSARMLKGQTDGCCSDLPDTKNG